MTVAASGTASGTRRARLLDDLDDRQRAAVTSTAAPLAILAGAGSGKTRVLTRRIAWQVAEGRVDPTHTLALTFTRKAAAELVGRLEAFGVQRMVTAGTFHSVALAQLRRRAADRRRAMPAILARKARILVPLVGGRGAQASVAASEIATEIEWAKARRVSADRYVAAVERAERTTPRPPDAVARVYARYEQEKRNRKLVDFDDLIWSCADALRRDTEFAATQRWRFRHLFVDEFQDATPAQVALVRGWLGDRVDLTVVGDPDQAIYGFAGGTPWYLADFARHFPGGATVALAVNYRSTPQVIATAQAVLPRSSAARPAESARGPGPSPTISERESETDEARSIAVALRRSRTAGRAWSDDAIVFRTNAQSAAFEAALHAEGVPFRVRGGTAFLSRPEVRASLDELRRSASVAPGRRLRAQLDDLVDTDTGGEELREHADAIARLGHEYLDIDNDGTVDGFLAYLQVALRGEVEPTSVEAVELLTFHRAKGLEFERVYVTGLERGLVPISHANSAADLAEEHRLLYVALSRAHEELHLSWARRRNDRNRQPSPWLARLADTIDSASEPSPDVDPATRLEPARRRLSSGRRESVPDVPAADEPLFNALKDWRRHLARAAKVPAYVVFDDRTLGAVARNRPVSRGELLDLPGIGPVKAERYGEALLDLVRRHG